MQILFMGSYFPGSFKQLLTYFVQSAKDRPCKIVFISEHRRRDFNLPFVKQISVRFPRAARSISNIEQIALNSVNHMEAFTYAMQSLKEKGFYPDIVIASDNSISGVARVFPRACAINYATWYYEKMKDQVLVQHNKLLANAIKPLHIQAPFQIQAILNSHCTIVANETQKGTYPKILQNKIFSLSNGVDIDFCNSHNHTERADIMEAIRPEVRELLNKRELISYIARNSDEYSAFSTVCEAVPYVLAARPQSELIIITQSVASTENNLEYKKMLEIAGNRVHIISQCTWNEYFALLRQSALCIYMNISQLFPSAVLDAMYASCLVVGSDTEAVREMIKHKENGFLVDFFNSQLLTDTVISALELDAKEKERIYQNAKELVLETYNSEKLIPMHYNFILRLYEKIRENELS